MKSTPAFDAYWRATRHELDTALQQWLPVFFRGLGPGDLDAVQHALAHGKRLRGCLLCLVCDALGGHRDHAWPRAVAVECVQAASLIHDDFVDRDALRRDQPAVWTRYGPRRAVLLGDLIFATALREMVALGRDDGIALAHVIATMARGAWQEPIELGHAEWTRVASGAKGARYRDVIYLKTGVLFGTAARLGAIAAAAPQMADVAFEFGVQLGEAYQIADDVRDMVDAGRGPDAAPEPANRALLTLAIGSFLGTAAAARHAASAENAGERAALLNELRSRMHAAIDERVQRATRALEPFSRSAHTQLLCDAPRAIVDMMLRDQIPARHPHS
jgi:geranylgeranyl pyrophosphate synthase